MFDRLEEYGQFETFLATFTNYERVQSPPYDKESMGTERMRAFLELLGDPHLAQPAVHVAGSKGKGSTCLALEAILLAEGYRVGTYLSPHVEHLRERIRVNGVPVEEGELVEALNAALGALEALRGRRPSAFPSFFELLTALAMSIFRGRGVDWAIYEVGLGGRLDATNVVSPAVSAVTSIELEHTEQLGTTLAAIAREKAGIVKPGVPVVVGGLEEEARREIAEIARARGAPLIVSPKTAVSRAGGGLLRIEDPAATIPAGRIVGPGLRADLGIAIAIAREVLAGAGRSLDRAALAAAVSRLELPARVEILEGPPPAVVDAAHTERAVQSLKAALEEAGFPRPRTLIFSLSRGKGADRILPQLPELAESAVFTRADPTRSIPPSELRDRLGMGAVEEVPEEALRSALAAGRALVVTGSFYLAGRLRPLLRSACGGPAPPAPLGAREARRA